eukprot:Plantae.Rhodophyta-Hildenbrandia_rubra.ctg1634.p2 GENE.Plantae.Rhodophyta-Hildenbrandia_rubra.ctg1634~~Plantae.Rhodophyta-Hildenbrandia_rubra.ctg1634.p2  ORF type:complete len:231 (+),score=80.18 Plantae.Rhodophyta-Hildenbrandia_rubra.ctg1634:573-1265(+)
MNNDVTGHGAVIEGVSKDMENGVTGGERIEAKKENVGERTPGVQDGINGFNGHVEAGKVAEIENGKQNGIGDAEVKKGAVENDTGKEQNEEKMEIEAVDAAVENGTSLDAQIGVVNEVKNEEEDVEMEVDSKDSELSSGSSDDEEQDSDEQLSADDEEEGEAIVKKRPRTRVPVIIPDDLKRRSGRERVAVDRFSEGGSDEDSYMESEHSSDSDYDIEEGESALFCLPSL